MQKNGTNAEKLQKLQVNCTKNAGKMTQLQLLSLERLKIPVCERSFSCISTAEIPAETCEWTYLHERKNAFFITLLRSALALSQTRESVFAHSSYIPRSPASLTIIFGAIIATGACVLGQDPRWRSTRAPRRG